jgi:hypothetical protein
MFSFQTGEISTGQFGGYSSGSDTIDNFHHWLTEHRIKVPVADDGYPESRVASQQACQSAAGPAGKPDRGALTAQLQPRSQSRRATPCRPEVHAGLKGAEAHKRQTQGGNQGAHGLVGKQSERVRLYFNGPESNMLVEADLNWRINGVYPPLQTRGCGPQRQIVRASFSLETCSAPPAPEKPRIVSAATADPGAETGERPSSQKTDSQH